MPTEVGIQTWLALNKGPVWILASARMTALRF